MPVLSKSFIVILFLLTVISLHKSTTYLSPVVSPHVMNKAKASQKQDPEQQSPDSTSVIQDKTALPSLPDIKPPQIPTRLIIPQIDLNASVIPQGKLPDGRPAVPDDNQTIGWWLHGKKPGEVGNAVLAGHYRIADGSPGVFYHLSELALGDQITVEDATGTRRVFEIIHRQVFPEGLLPLERVYRSQDDVVLNLITCAGNYVPQLDDYSHRLVLFTRLV